MTTEAIPTAVTAVPDWAPGENHVVLREQELNFYAPEVFHNCQIIDNYIPLLIHDINTSQDIYQIYVNHVGCLDYLIMVNNWPIKKVQVFGRIIEETIMSEKSLVLIKIDDSSDDNSCITLRLKIDLFLSIGLNMYDNYGKIISVEGKISRIKSNVQILVDEIKILRHRDTLSIEIDCWRERLDYRNEILSKPWVFSPQSKEVQVVYTPKFSPREIKRQEEKNKLKVVNPIAFESQLIEDSLNIYRDVNGPKYKNESPTKITNEVLIEIQICKYIIQNNYPKIKFTQLLNNIKVSELLNNLTSYKYQTSPINLQQNVQAYKSIIFRKIQYDLQENYKLISVSDDMIKSSNLKELVKRLKKILKRLPTGSKLLVEKLTDLFINKGLVGNVNVDLINGLIDYVKDEERNWVYDKTAEAWSYTGSKRRFMT
ncbi:unnamed protein product [Candida verbasci]|uniref:CST complex subunit Stn1 N-terminal domain-containing protein n=1 Tax=Candida verbasci TaxID=1227364 RepID=A0A9W4TXD7_9ASCO|nr:unnamed protein product [Candida verbasci]